MMNGIRLLSGFGPSLNVYGTKLVKFSLCGGKPSQLMISRVYSQQGRETVWRTTRARRQTFAEAAAKPATGTAISVGEGMVAGGCVIGIGALAYYGLGMSNQAGIIENSMLWPQYVRDRIQATYLYFGSSIVITVGAAIATFKTPALLNFASRSSLVVLGVTFAALIGTGFFTMSLDYAPKLDLKHAGWILHSSLLGVVLSPIAIMGGAPVIKAMWYTAAVVGALTTIAVCAPNDRFLYMGGPMAMALGFVFISSIGTLFIPTTTALGAGLSAFTLYGGLLVFSGFLLFDTQRIVKMAEEHPVNSIKPFDPINASISIYMDTVNIFIRLVQIFGGANRKH